MILGVHHPALAVPDMKKALDFYCSMLGFEPVMEADIPSGIALMSDAFGLDDAGCKVAMIKKGNSCIELFQFESSQEGDPVRPVNKHGISHICLATDDYEKDLSMLTEAGVSFNTDPVGAAPTRWVYGRDPFGNVIELLEHDPESASSLDFA